MFRPFPLQSFVFCTFDCFTIGKEGNFKKHFSNKVQTFKTEYDYGSVMHYSSHSFSKNGKATIIPRKNVVIGQRNGFSNLDLQEINALYQCNSKFYLKAFHLPYSYIKYV